MLSADGKRYNTDVATTAQLLRIIQSIPSKKAAELNAVVTKLIENSVDKES